MSFVKWVSISSVGVFVLAGGLYLNIPSSVDDEVSVNVKRANADSEDVSRTLYGVPNLKLDHYRLSEDDYFDIQIDGVLNVGRNDPAKYPLWKDYVDDMIANSTVKGKKKGKNDYYKNQAIQELIADSEVLESEKRNEEDVEDVGSANSDTTKDTDGTVAGSKETDEGSDTSNNTSGESNVGTDAAKSEVPSSNTEGNVVDGSESGDETNVDTTSEEGKEGVVDMGDKKDVVDGDVSNN